MDSLIAKEVLDGQQQPDVAVKSLSELSEMHLALVGGGSADVFCQ